MTRPTLLFLFKNKGAQLFQIWVIFWISIWNLSWVFPKKNWCQYGEYFLIAQIRKLAYLFQCFLYLIQIFTCTILRKYVIHDKSTSSFFFHIFVLTTLTRGLKLPNWEKNVILYVIVVKTILIFIALKSPCIKQTLNKRWLLNTWMYIREKFLGKMLPQLLLVICSNSNYNSCHYMAMVYIIDI